MTSFRYPCTGQVKAEGFGAFLEENLGVARGNLLAFTRELDAQFTAPYITLVNSGSSANLVAALALAEKLRHDNKPLEAVTSAYTFPTTLSALMMAGFSVRLVDTEKNGFNMCPAALRRALNEKAASLVCVTHFLGFPAAMDDIMPLARASGALVLQDACETMRLTSSDGQPMHSLGDMTTWSFYHPHHLSSYGGGAVLAVSEDDFRLCDSLAHWGRACTCHIDPAACTAPKGFRHNFTYVRPGVNVEMSELNAAFGRFQLKNWNDIERRRHQHYAFLYGALQDVPGVAVYTADPQQGSPFVFPVRLLDKNAADIVERLAVRGVECRTLMGGAMIEQPAFRHLPHDGNHNARATAAASFFVGIHQTLETDDVVTVAAIIREELLRENAALAA